MLIHWNFLLFKSEIITLKLVYILTRSIRSGKLEFWVPENPHL